MGSSTRPRTSAPATTSASTTDDFTTHGVIVGMTGSGKTGLGVVLIEEVLRAGLPALLIDPKGDLTNLCLTFPDLAPGRFRPWIDEAQAKTAGVTPDEFAAQQAKRGRTGWPAGASGPSRIAALRAATDFTIYTPGLAVGRAAQHRRLAAGPGRHERRRGRRRRDRGLRRRACSAWSASRPTRCRAASTSCSRTSSQHSWAQGTRSTWRPWSGMVQQPPMRKLGVFELDQFFPPADRMALAMQLNGLLASPSFAAWGDGRSARHPVDAAHRRRHGPLRDRHHRPPVRRGAPVRQRR